MSNHAELEKWNAFVRARVESIRCHGFLNDDARLLELVEELQADLRVAQIAIEHLKESHNRKEEILTAQNELIQTQQEQIHLYEQHCEELRQLAGIPEA